MASQFEVGKGVPITLPRGLFFVLPFLEALIGEKGWKILFWGAILHGISVHVWQFFFKTIFSRIF